MTDRKDVDDLMEKYYHSMGATLAEEGDLEEAVVFLQKAIDVRDTPYAWYGFARVLRETGDIAGAVGAMSKAIKLAPGTPEYYHERGLLLRQLGRPDLADEDGRRAIAIDRNYERTDEIARAAGIVGEFFPGTAVPDDIGNARAQSEGLARVLEEIGLEGQQLSDAFRKPSCPVGPCPAYCCHFTGKLLRHGVTVGPWKLNALRGYFMEKGIMEKDLLETFPVAELEYAERLFAPQDIMKKGDLRFVVFPRQNESPLGRELARDIPKGKDHKTLMWINESARPCVFLKDRKCSIYDLGGEPSLDPCASFLCMTGFVFVVLKHLGFVDGELLAAKTMGQLNGIAVDALIILARDVCGTETNIAAARQEIRELFKQG